MLELGPKVVDLSADFRLPDAGLYERTYEHAHPAPQFLAEAPYGLTELAREQVRAARLVANPGCYPTATLLARCKMGEIEEQVLREGLPAVSANGIDECCETGEVEGFECEWEIMRIVLPDAIPTPLAVGPELDGEGVSQVRGHLARHRDAHPFPLWLRAGRSVSSSASAGRRNPSSTSRARPPRR